MSILPEKIALQRLLQHYAEHLAEAIVELVSAEPSVTGGLAPPALATVAGPSVFAPRFCEDNIIVWEDRQHVFSPSTYMLLKQLFDAPDMTLSKEDVRQDVMGDDDAREGTVRQCISAARKELRRTRFPYRIETITRKGYRLVAEK